METNEDKPTALLRMLLGDHIPESRLVELLEASNGRLEQAVDIYFHQQSSVLQSKDQQQRATSTSKRAATIAAASSGTKLGSPKKQAQLDSFFSLKRKSISSSTVSSAKKHSKFESPEAASPLPSEQHQHSQNHVDDDSKVDEGSPRHPLDQNKEKKQETAAASTDAINIPCTNRKEDDNEDTSWSSLVSFQRMAEVLQQMADTTKRTVKLNALKSFIRSIMGLENTNMTKDALIAYKTKILVASLDLVLGGRTTTVSPLNVSESAISKAVTTTLGLSRAQLSKAYRQYGDLGDCAASFFQKQKFFVTKSPKKRLSILDVSEALARISATDGRDAKQHIVLQIFRLCDSRSEIRFLARLLVNNMRIGANLKTILAALAMAIMPENETSQGLKKAIDLVQKTHDLCPSLEKIITAVLQGGIEQMQRDCTIQVLIPIAPMLAHPIHSIAEVQKAMEEDKETDMNDGEDHANDLQMSQHPLLMEWKYVSSAVRFNQKMCKDSFSLCMQHFRWYQDGMRCQAHWDGTTIKLFSRHMLEITNQFPDVGQYILDAAKSATNVNTSSFIIDSEIVAVEGERLLPFQDLSTRRKKNETDNVEGVRVKVFAFDLMYLNGESYANAPLWRRKELLHNHFIETPDFAFVQSQKLDSFDESKLTQYLADAVKNGTEGLMLKLLGSRSICRAEDEAVLPASTCTYEAGTRSRNWLKMKRDYVAGYADTIDVVPIGAWYGNGRKAQKSFLSPVLLAVYDDEEDVFRSISRCLGFTDKMFESMREFYLHGTPYPAELDMAVGNERQFSESFTTVREDIAEEEINETDSEQGNIRQDGKDDSETSSAVDNEATNDRVNCFPNRPSSAFVITNESPPIWFKPLEVFEVSFADMSLSQKHTAAAGLVDDTDGRGVALRFCRFKRRRPDKKPEQATTSVQVAQMFAQQSKTGTRSMGKV
jgi:DNA ligase-1